MKQNETTNNRHPQNGELQKLANLDREEAFIDELRSIWDEQSQRIDKVLAEHRETHPHSLNFSNFSHFKRRLVIENTILLLINIAICLTIVLFPTASPYHLHQATLFIIFTSSLLMAIHCLYVLLSISRHSIFRTGTTHISRLFVSGPVATASFAVIIVFVSISFFSIGDSHAMTTINPTERVEIINNVYETLERI